MQNYATRLATEISIYEDCTDVHALPAIFDYWSERYLRPLFSQFGFEHPHEMFASRLEELCASSSGTARFVSLGSGNCSTEVAIASRLMTKGYSRFVIECFDLNSKMLGRGAEAAEKAGVSDRVIFQQGDLNDWNPRHEYDAIMADQSLHHIVCLETLFDRVREALKTKGSFLIYDMIGRNGHQRWPEALTLVHEFWRKLPPSYRYNQSLKRYEEMYENWDCSQEGFEGIRSQDILPLLLERFQFSLFLGFGNIIDPFVDRAFGPNFNPAAPWDRNFIDEVHFRDQQCLLSGYLKPTHMVAAVSKNAAGLPLIYKSLSPEFCVRATEEILVTDRKDTAAMAVDPYDWNAWPHNPYQELEFAYRMFKERGQIISEMEKELEKRAAWGFGLDEQLRVQGQQIRALHQRVQDRDQQIAELRQYLNNPLRYAMRCMRAVYKRAKKVFGIGVGQ